MTERLEVYKCEACGIIVEVLEGGAGTLVCCGSDMVPMEPKTADTGTEKHVPYIEASGGVTKVRVGQNEAHPMLEKHYIQWIELLVDGKVYRQRLNPGDEPAAEFNVTGENVSAREYCNVHGLWKS